MIYNRSFLINYKTVSQKAKFINNYKLAYKLMKEVPDVK